MSEKTPEVTKLHLVHLKSLQPHHRWLLMYGIIQAGVAVLSGAFLWANQTRITLPMSGGHDSLSHPLWVVLFVPFLLMTALTYVSLSAIRSSWWLRAAILLVVSAVLMYLGWSLDVLAYMWVPTLGLAGYVLWRGSQRSSQLPGYTDVAVIGGMLALAFAVAMVFGLRVAATGPLGTLYLGVAELVAIAGFLPTLLLLLAGMDVAELFAELTGRVSGGLGRTGGRTALVALLVLSLAKLGFYGWRGLPPIDSGLFAALFFIGLLVWVTRALPRQWLEFEPRFSHWLALASFAMAILMLGSVVLAVSANLARVANLGPVMLATIGPWWLLFAGVLALRKKFRPFALFAALAGCWVTLSIGLAPIMHLLTGRAMPGLNLRDLDFISASLFVLWGLWLLVRRQTSEQTQLFVQISLFLSFGFLLDELLGNHIAVAEWYGLLQGVMFFLVRYLPSRKKQLATLSLVLVLVIAAAFVIFGHSHASLTAWLGQFFASAAIAGAIVWDVLVSEHRMGALESETILSRPGRLFLYLGFMTWAAAQFLFARTSESFDVFGLEPVVSLGFVIFGMPSMFFLFMREFRAEK